MRILLISIILLPCVALADQQVTLSAPGMSCPVCPITISKSLERIEGVEVLSASIESKLIVVSKPDSVEESQLTATTAAAGYPSTIVDKLELQQ